MRNILQVAQNGLSYFFKQHLFLTNVGISFGLSGVGDVLQQKYENVSRSEDPEVQSRIASMKYKVDFWRSLHMSICFGFTSGVLCHYWYKYLEVLVPGSGIRIVCKKILYDQLVFSPICIGSCLFTAGLVERQKIEKLKQDIIVQGCELYVAEWLLWPPAQFINFYFLPMRYRVAYDNLVSLVYDVYTSHVKHKPRAKIEL